MISEEDTIIAPKLASYTSFRYPVNFGACCIMASIFIGIADDSRWALRNQACRVRWKFSRVQAEVSLYPPGEARLRSTRPAPLSFPLQISLLLILGTNLKQIGYQSLRQPNGLILEAALNLRLTVFGLVENHVRFRGLIIHVITV